MEVNKLGKYLAVAVSRTYDRRGIDALVRRSRGKASVPSTMTTVIRLGAALDEKDNVRNISGYRL